MVARECLKPAAAADLERNAERIGRKTDGRWDVVFFAVHYLAWTMARGKEIASPAGWVIKTSLDWIANGIEGKARDLAVKHATRLETARKAAKAAAKPSDPEPPPTDEELEDWRQRAANPRDPFHRVWKRKVEEEERRREGKPDGS